jgi:hypothetical protein
MTEHTFACQRFTLVEGKLFAKVICEFDTDELKKPNDERYFRNVEVTIKEDSFGKYRVLFFLRMMGTYKYVRNAIRRGAKKSEQEAHVRRILQAFRTSELTPKKQEKK